MTDEELVARARGGDTDAFGTLVDRHHEAVHRAVLAALGSVAEADDAAQDAFVKAWQHLGRFRGEASFKTWLLTIAWHQGINRRRALNRWWRAPFAARMETTDIAPPDVPSGDCSPEQAAAGSELRATLVREIRALPPKLRDALLLAQAGVYTYQEMSAMLRAPAGTIKWRVSEARRLVRLRLQELGVIDVGRPD